MLFLRRKNRNNVLQGNGAPFIPRTRRRPGKNNRSRAFAVMVACFVLNFGSIFAIAAGTGPTSRELLEQGRKLLKAGKLAEAELVLDRAEKLAPSDSVILTLDAKVKGRLGEYSGAVDLLKHVIGLTPESAQAHVDLAIALADSGDLDGALAETATAISIAPGLAIAHLNRARILSDMKQDREAGDEFVSAARLAPGNPDCYFYWSFAERARGDFAKEAELLQKVVKLEPGNVNAHIRLANNLLDQNRTAEAVAELRMALAVDPNSAQAVYKLSRALHTTDPEESKRLHAQFDQLKAQNSVVDQAKARANEAFHAFTVQDWRESVRLFSEALETCGDCEIESTLHRDLGLTLCRDGQIERGAEELRRALALNPEDRDAAKALEAIRALNKSSE
ncbi:tetratricopeptide repeat protein [Acidicapsa acidisoli]|uniref:tetratricopeptide repeat protein n=1 Tax=Acidicapsa acidisoli TaxID=1615681 RepID=UPI0021DFBB68|nr:tetratricopeptide repeat protein [Acidicapsa acidisoli]